VRVVAGSLRGRRLEAPPGDDVRPTSDRAREALFSMLGDVAGLRVLDLFCGTGALGIEALSRGAGRATFVDTDPALAERNVDALGLGDQAEVVRGEASAYLARGEEPFGLILCDPPYRLAAPLEADLAKLIPGRLVLGGRLVVESAARDPHALELPLELERERRYGAALLRIWKRVS
jgi:16S rRNA (guanine966-N2)-methyltransferase